MKNQQLLHDPFHRQHYQNTHRHSVKSIVIEMNSMQEPKLIELNVKRCALIKLYIKQAILSFIFYFHCDSPSFDSNNILTRKKKKNYLHILFIIYSGNVKNWNAFEYTPLNSLCVVVVFLYCEHQPDFVVVYFKYLYSSFIIIISCTTTVFLFFCIVRVVHFFPSSFIIYFSLEFCSSFYHTSATIYII